MNWQSASLAAGRIAGVCSQESPADRRAAETLTELRRLVPFTAASLASWDGAGHVVVADSGYRATTLADLNGAWYLQDPMWHVTAARRVPTRWRDMPSATKASRIYSESLRPQGYLEGMTAPFYRADGSYAGMLTLNTDSVAHPSDPAVEVLRFLSQRLSRVVDAFGGQDARKPPDDVARVAVSPTGSTTVLSGGPEGIPAEVLDGLHRAADPRTPGTYLVWTPGTRTPWRVRFTPAPAPGLPRLATCAPAVVPGGLSRREVEVLTVLASGASNEEIARALHASPRTVSTHVEHILAKLEVRSRTEAAVRAVSEGLLVLAD